MQFSIGTFEGPLDLLLALVRKEEMDIVDIDLNKVTHQYLQVMEESKDLIQLNEAGEFIRMASILIYLKSKSLLPEIIEELAAEDLMPEISKEDLIQALLQHQHFMKAGETLNERLLLNRDVWATSKYSIIESDDIEAHIKGSPSLLFKTCYRLLKQLYTYQAKVVFPSVTEWIMRIKKYFVQGNEFKFTALLKDKEQPRTHQIVLSFLTLLELGKLGFVSLKQEKNDIKIYSKKTLTKQPFEVARELQ